MDSANSQQQRSLSDLPIGTLSHVSSYLAPPSRALFAVALDYYRDNDSSSAIVGDQRDVLDFGDIEKQLAAKLTDDDVRNILLSIDAINNLKTLRLTNLLNITGIGLEPLRGSTTIEKIDLSLVGDRESPNISPAPSLSCTEAVPILDSIIDMGGASSLKLLIFPEEWRRERNTDSEFHAFLVRYNQLWRSRVVTCLKCDVILSEGDLMLLPLDRRQYGMQFNTCYDCLKHYCVNCVEEEDGEFCMSSPCGICNRRYCLHCSRSKHCNSCDEWFCVNCIKIEECFGCDEITCLKCASERGCRNTCCDGKIWCNECGEEGHGLVSCEIFICDAECCVDCYESNNTGNVYSIDYCNVCDEDLCGKHRVIKCKNGRGCTGCYQFAVRDLLEDKERLRQEMQTMQTEIDEQKEENSELKEENNELKRKLEDLIG